MYIAREYERIVPVRDRYRTTLVRNPTPKFIVFYNGTEDYPVEETLKLSTAYMETEEDVSLELAVKVININMDKHHEVLQK